jgi:hypothetical protein
VKRVWALLLLLALAGAGAVGYAVTRPDPETEARQDGCGRSRQAEFARQAPGWVYVGDRGYPAGGPTPPVQWIDGVVRAAGNQAEAVHPSGGDDPTTHDSFDFNLNILPDPAYAGLLGGREQEKTGNFEGEGEETGRIHIERELKGFPTFAWAEAGDRVKVMGSWVWDCGHWDPGGERTELHPYRAMWVERRVSSRSPWGEAEGDLYVSTQATPAGQIAECAHRSKGDPAAYKACTFAQPDWLDVSGDYDLTLPAPPKPPGATRLVARVVDRGSTVPVPAPVVSGGVARLRFRLAAMPGTRLVVAKQVFLGWTPVRAAALPVHLRVRFTRVLVRRAMDPGCASYMPGCGSPRSTLDGQISASPGEFRIFSDVAGQWLLWPALYRGGDGDAFAPHVVQDVYVPRNGSWRLLLWPHECDFGTLSWSDPNGPMAPCPKSQEFGNFSGDDLPGLVVARFTGAALGARHANASTAPPSTCPASNMRGCLAFDYRVERVRDEAGRVRRR